MIRIHPTAILEDGVSFGEGTSIGNNVRIRRGASLGDECVIGTDLEIGRWAVVGTGSRVVKSVPDFHLVLGSPAGSVGVVCKCGRLFHNFVDGDSGDYACECGLEYSISDRVAKEKGAASTVLIKGTQASRGRSVRNEYLVVS